MKTTSLLNFILIAVVAVMMQSVSCGGETVAKGIIVFFLPPSPYPDSAEFVNLAKRNAFFTEVWGTNGVQREVPNAGIIGVLDYPNAGSNVPPAQRANTYLSQIDGILAKYPRSQFPDLHLKLNNLAAKEPLI